MCVWVHTRIFRVCIVVRIGIQIGLPDVSGYSWQEHYEIDIHQLATTIPLSATIIPLSKMVLPAQHDVPQVVVGQEAEISAAQLAARAGDGQTRETPIHVAKDAIDRLEGANQSMGDVVG